MKESAWSEKIQLGHVWWHILRTRPPHGLRQDVAGFEANMGFGAKAYPQRNENLQFSSTFAEVR